MKNSNGQNKSHVERKIHVEKRTKQRENPGIKNGSNKCNDGNKIIPFIEKSNRNIIGIK